MKADEHYFLVNLFGFHYVSTAATVTFPCILSFILNLKFKILRIITLLLKKTLKRVKML